MLHKHSSLAGKRIVIGVTGSIAAFKVAGWVSSLSKEEALVDVIMTASAKQFVTPLTFSSLSGRYVYDDMFTAETSGTISHIGLAHEADCIIVAPATAQTIARLAHGFADDLLSTTVLAARVPVFVCPAMNVHMYQHVATQRNLEVLKQYGYQVVDPDCGVMACGDVGQGRLPEWELVREFVLRTLSEPDLAGQMVLVTAGPTRESIDPARYLSNRSSGKMGYAIARTAFRRGATVKLVSGPTSLACPVGVERIVVNSAEEMRAEVLQCYQEASIIVKAAAVADFRCAEVVEEKIKKHHASLELKLQPNPDILLELGSICDRKRQLLIGFAAESSAHEQEGRRKLKSKNLDLVAVNNIKSDNTGFAGDSNQITLIDAAGATVLPHAPKEQCADLLWDYIIAKGLLKR